MSKKITLEGLDHFKDKENAMIAGKPESTNTATVAHAVGEYFYWKGVLHIVTAAIAVGGTIQTNTNVKPAVLADDVSDLKTALNEKYDMIAMRTYNLFDKTNAEVVKMVTGGTVNQNNNTRSVIIPVTITDQTSIAVTKTVPSSRFAIAVFTSKPVVGSSSVTYAANNAATSLTVNVTSSIKYLMVYFWLSSADTNITPEEVLDGLMVEFGNKFTKYVEPYQPINQPQLNNLEDVITYPKGTDIPLTFTNTTGYYNANGSFTEYSGVSVARVTVEEGEQYLLTSRHYNSAVPVAFFNSSDTYVGYALGVGGTSAIEEESFAVPANASYMLIERVNTYPKTYLQKVVGIKPVPVKSVLQGKKVTLIGDSITEYNLRAKTNWALYLANWCGAVVQNLGASGTGFIAGSSNPYSNRIASINNPDIIGVALSFNDMNNTIEDLTTAAETFFDNLITAYPSTPIICYVQSPWSAYHYGITASDAWVNALREVCNTRGIPFYDELYKGCVLKPWNASNRQVYYINDGEGSTGEEDWAHPNSEGHKVIARTLYPLFAKNIVATGLDYYN